jgi:outer membrane biosynthesis protein TonB
MKAHQLKFSTILLLLLCMMVMGLSNCGPSETKGNADVLIDSTKLNSEIPVANTDSSALAATSPVNVDNTITAPEVGKTDPKTQTETVKTTTVVTTVTNTKPTVPTNTPAPPVIAPKPVPVVDKPLPTAPVPVTVPKPVEAPKPIPVIVPEPAQDDWVVPAKYKSMTSPFPINKESIELGKSIYFTHCKSCHGGKGEGNGPKSTTIDTKMRSFQSAGFKAQNQGEVYYKSMIGRKDMPKFDKKIPDTEEQWALVNYIRSF